MVAVAPKKQANRDPFIITAQVAKKQIGMADDAYRDMLDRVAGCRSSTKVPFGKRQAVLDEFKRLGATNTRPVRTNRSGVTLEGQYAGKLRALWIAGYNLGIMRDRSDAALMKFVTRQTKIDHTRWLTNNADATKAINALKKWLEREGDVTWRSNSLAQPYETTPQYRTFEAQLRYAYEHKLIFCENLQSIRTAYAIKDYADARCGISRDVSVSEYTDAHWQTLMNTLGGEIRAHKGGAS